MQEYFDVLTTLIASPSNVSGSEFPRNPGDRTTHNSTLLCFIARDVFFFLLCVFCFLFAFSVDDCVFVIVTHSRARKMLKRIESWILRKLWNGKAIKEANRSRV